MNIFIFYYQPDRCDLFPEAMSLATTKATTTVELKSQAKLFEGRIFFIHCTVKKVRKLSFFFTSRYFFNISRQYLTMYTKNILQREFSTEPLAD